MLRILFTVVFVALITESSGQTKKCPDDWTLYEPEMVCAQHVHNPSSYEDARKSCQDKGGDLLQIVDRRMDKSVRGSRKLQRDYWIGVSDYNEDGVFEYIDGTKLTTGAKGLGHWSEYSYIANTGRSCVSRSRSSWHQKSCSDKRYFTCEKKSQPGQKDCQGVWKLYKEESVCIRDVLKKKKWHKARKECKKEHDGNLVQITTKEKEKFVEDESRSWNSRSKSRWIGVYDNNKDGIFDYVNGSRLFTLGYGLGHWGVFIPYNTEKKNSCVSQAQGRGWFNDDCSEKRYYICGMYLNRSNDFTAQTPETTNKEDNDVDKETKEDEKDDDLNKEEENKEEGPKENVLDLETLQMCVPRAKRALN